MWFYYLIFCFILSFHFYFRNKKIEAKVGYILCILLIVIAAFRPPDIDRDYLNYNKYYENISVTGGSTVEISMRLIVYVVKKFFNNFFFVILIYALLGIMLKYIAIKKICEYWVLSLLIYFGYFYICYDMTQIREGVAMAFFLLSIPDIKERKLKPYLIKFAIAIFFHYSAIIMLPVFFIVRPDKRSFLPYLCLLLFSISSILYMNKDANLITLIQYIPIKDIQRKFLFYVNYREKGIFDTINIFTIARIMRLLLLILMVVCIRPIERKNQYARTLIQIYIIAQSVFFLLSSLPPVFSYRISEFLGIVEIIIFTFIAYIIKPRIIGEIAVVCIAVIFMLYNLLIHQYIQPYF